MATRRKAGAIFPNSTGLKDDLQSLRLLVRLLGIRSAELDTLLSFADKASDALDKLNRIGERVDVPTVVLKTGGKTFNISAGIRRTA